MSKKLNLFMVISVVILSLVSCRKETDEEMLNKAQEIYNEKGFDKYLKFVETESKYFPIKDDSKNGATPFLIAINDKNLDAASLLVEKGANIQEVDNSKNDILDYVIGLHDKEYLKDVCKLLPNSYYNKVSPNGEYPIIKLIKHNAEFSVLEKPLSLIQDIDMDYGNGKTLLMYAAQYYTNVRLVKAILDKGASKDIKNNNEWTAIMYAARYNPNPLVLEDLIIRGASLSSNSVGLDLSMLASCNKNPGVLFTLMNYDFPTNNQTKRGMTALMYACENNVSVDILKILLDNGANVNIKDSNGKTCFMYGLEKFNDPAGLYLLLTAGVNKEDKDKNGKTTRDYLASNKILMETDFKDIFDFNEKPLSEQSTVTESETISSDETKIIEEETELTEEETKLTEEGTKLTEEGTKLTEEGTKLTEEVTETLETEPSLL